MLPAALKARAERRARARGTSLGELIRVTLAAAVAERDDQHPLFSDDVAKSMISTQANRDAAAASLAAVVSQYGFDGVMFDLEALSAGDAKDGPFQLRA